MPVRGRWRSTAVLSFEPEAALAWIHLLANQQMPAGQAALDRLCRGARRLVAGALAELAQQPLEIGSARLYEEAVAGTLLRSHAPPDAALLSAELILAGTTSVAPGVLYVLADAKGLPAPWAGIPSAEGSPPTTGG